MASTLSSVIYRPFAPDDFGPAANILRTTWCAGFGREAGVSASRQELAAYLAASTWGLVAEKDRRLVGVVLARIPGEEPFDRARWSHEAERARELVEGDAQACEEVRTELGGVEEEDALAAEFVAAEPPEADAVFKLLIVSPEAHGLGVGGHLFAAAEQRAREGGARGYYLMTDDSCDVSFYDHKGLVRQMHRRSQVAWPETGDDSEFEIYVYGRRF